MQYVIFFMLLLDSFGVSRLKNGAILIDVIIGGIIIGMELHT